MTDVEIAEQAIAVLHDKLHTATKRAHEIAADRQRLSYAVFVDGDPSARADLEKLNAIAIADKIDNIKAAIAEANKRLTQARDNVQREAAKQHFKKLHEQLDALQEMAGPLDACLGTYVKGSMGGLRYEPGLKNPPMLDRAGECIGQLFLAAKAIDECTGSDLRRGVSWPSGTWSRGHVADLRKVLEGVVMQYCSRIPSARNFAGLITALVASVKAALAQHGEQTTISEVAA
jgi:hypothetical protein